MYVAGLKKTGTTIIEKWQYPVRTGGRAIVTTSGPPQSIGIPMPPYSAAETVNGTFKPPTKGSYASALRTVLYDGPDLPAIRTMAADPEGRFLLALTFPDDELVQIDLMSAPPSYQTLYTQTELPRLPQGRTLNLFHHSALGRTYVLSEYLGDAAAKITLLKDFDNDGIVDVVEVITPTQWALGASYKNYWDLSAY